MAVYRCIEPFAAMSDGVFRVVRKGAVVDSSDRITVGRLANFEPVETAADRSNPDVEQATAAPGERRARSRPRG